MRAALATHHGQMPQVSAYLFDWTASQPLLPASRCVTPPGGGPT